MHRLQQKVTKDMEYFVALAVIRTPAPSLHSEAARASGEISTSDWQQQRSAHRRWQAVLRGRIPLRLLGNVRFISNSC